MTADASSSTQPRAGVDVVVPIYNAGPDVRRCVESILRHATGDWRLTLVDDASTDEALVAFLEETQNKSARTQLLRNEQNSGFVVSANRGMRHAEGRDVVLLNSDTIVVEGFIDKLAACTYADERTGIVSPLTNNGTICSVPRFCEDNDLPADMSVDEYGRLVSQTSLHRRPELVTAVGFCMYVRAEVFKRIGYFDEGRFGRGFGEENDFCERAKAAGYTIRLCDELFIAHTGKATFGEEGYDLERTHARTLRRRHPTYFRDVADFCRRNPLREIQENVRFHLARHRGRRHPAMMFLLHSTVFSKGMGGTEYLVRDLVENLALPRSLIAFPEGRHIVVAEVFAGRVADALVYRFDLRSEPAVFQQRDEELESVFGRILDLFTVGGAHIHHLMNWPIGLWRVLQGRGVPYIYTIHDAYCRCPNWRLFDHKAGSPCPCPVDVAVAPGECITAQCAEVGVPTPADPQSFLHQHRSEFAELLRNCEIIIAPSRSAFEMVRQCYGLANDAQVIPHGYDARRRAAADPSDEGGLRVALIGQVAHATKGAEAYLALMSDLRDQPIAWHVFGSVDVFGFRRRLEQLGLGERLHLHGAYAREEICDLLTTNHIDLSVILPTWAETFCFTLSESWLAGVPVVVSDLGALPERVAESGAGLVVQNAQEAASALRRLAADRRELQVLKDKTALFRHMTRQENTDRHRAAYGRIYNIVTTAVGVGETTDAQRTLFDIRCRTLLAGGALTETPRELYQRRWWYRYYQRVQPYLSPKWRALARRVYLKTRRTRIR